MKACLTLMFTESITNIDADTPGSNIVVTPLYSAEEWKMKMASISGYGPSSPGGPDLKRTISTP